jgi:hypothetical protein
VAGDADGVAVEDGGAEALVAAAVAALPGGAALAFGGLLMRLATPVAKGGVWASRDGTAPGKAWHQSGFPVEYRELDTVGP